MVRVLFFAMILSYFVSLGVCQDSKPDSSSVDKQIAEIEGKIRELVLLREKLLASKSSSSDSTSRKDPVNVFTEGRTLFKGLPAESYPAIGANAQIERARTLKWIGGLNGATVRWKVVVDEVKIGGKGPFQVDLVVSKNGLSKTVDRNEDVFVFGKNFKIGKVNCLVSILPQNFGHHSPNILGLNYRNVPEDVAVELRKLKGEEIELSSMIMTRSTMDRLLEKDRDNWGELVYSYYGLGPGDEHSLEENDQALFASTKDDKVVEVLAKNGISIKLAVLAPLINGNAVSLKQAAVFEAFKPGDDGF